MDYTLIERTSALTISLVLFAGMIVLFFLGRIFGKKLADEKSDEKSIVGTLRSAILALFGFILAFTFGMSGSRYENARNVFVEEANAIGTAILRADLYQDSTRDMLKASFRDYLEARIMMYSDLRDTQNIRNAEMISEKAQRNLWRLVTNQSKLPNMLIPSGQMVPALNSMFDIGTTRNVFLRTSIPDIIIYILIILGFVCGFLIGITSPEVTIKEAIVILSFAFFASLILYLAMDLGRPLRGTIRTHIAEQSITELRKLFDEAKK